eukprot:scaffold72002_cov17-Tisochrysis_lutea.AAC.1
MHSHAVFTRAMAQWCNGRLLHSQKLEGGGRQMHLACLVSRGEEWKRRTERGVPPAPCMHAVSNG